MTEGYNDLPAVVGNLPRARKSVGRLLRILGREGTDPKVMGKIFKAVTQAVLLFGANIWILTYRIEWDLSSFQHRVARRLTGMNPRRQGG